MIKDYFNLALNNLSQRRLRSWLTMIGIFIGIAAVISLIGLGEGLRVAIRSQFGFLGTDIISVQASGLNFAGPPGSGAVTPLEESLVDELKDINGVETSFGRRLETGTVKFNGQFIIGYVASYPGGEDRKTFEMMVNLEALEGRLLRDEDNGVLLGYNYQENEDNENGLHAGDRIEISGKTYDIIGIMERKGSFVFDNAILMNDDTMDDLFGDKDTTDIIAVKVRDEKDVPKIREDVEKVLRKERDVDVGEEDFEVSTPQQTLDQLNSSLFAVQLFVYIISSVSLLVGGIGIMNTMYTAVLERRKEIGIMKAIGARNSMIFKLFFIESGFLGMVGGLIGIGLGLLLAYGLASAGRAALGADLIQAKVSPYLIVGALMFSFGLGTFFGILPARQAAKLHPVEALRK